MKKVLVGMSGGVDSSVCAFLLKEQGYDVIGVTLSLWDDDETVCARAGHVGCCGESAVNDAMAVCSRLSIPFSVFSMKDYFREKVVDPFCEDYLRGMTPNPCIACNRYLKWGAMLKKADELGADYIATGHYATIARTDTGRYAIKKSKSVSKDQTYVLYHLSQEQLSRTLFPIGEYEKDEIRGIASDLGFAVAKKKDSQDICFIPDGDYGAFIEREVDSSILPKTGEFVSTDGKVLGTHDGAYHFTYGQRKGLGIALGERAFVCDIDSVNNRVVLGKDEDCFSDALIAEDVCQMAEERFREDEVYIAKIRYSDKGSECHVSYEADGQIRITFKKPVRAITPGQAVVIYKDEYVAGGATIVNDL